MTFKRAYREELECWRLSQDQRALLLAFLYCMKLRMEGIDFERHWDAMCGQDRVELDGRDYVT